MSGNKEQAAGRAKKQKEYAPRAGSLPQPSIGASSAASASAPRAFRVQKNAKKPEKVYKPRVRCLPPPNLDQQALRARPYVPRFIQEEREVEEAPRAQDVAVAAPVQAAPRAQVPQPWEHAYNGVPAYLGFPPAVHQVQAYVPQPVYHQAAPPAPMGVPFVAPPVVDNALQVIYRNQMISQYDHLYPDQ